MLPLHIRCFPLLLLFGGLLQAQWALGQAGGGVVAKAVLDGSQGQIAADSSRTVQDSAFFNPDYTGDIDTSYTVQNLITLEINEASNVFLRDTFTVSVQLEITYTTGAKSVDSVSQTLTVHYDSAKAYNSRNSFVFSGAHEVTIRVVSVTSTVTSWSPATALLLIDQLTANPDFAFHCSNTVSTVTVSPSGLSNADELPVNWTAVLGADQYDLEWTFIDSSALSVSKYGDSTGRTAAFSDQVFLNNATRSTVTGTSYNIPLIFDNTGTVFIRVRAVQTRPGNAVLNSEWSSDASAFGLGEFSFRGHERPLNWQSSITFAEEGKRKVVVQYFDGSLRSRQTVTKDNTTDTTIIAETYYDYQGRPTIQVMPSPTLSSIIQYTAGFNVGINEPSYTQTDYDTILNPDLYCSISADSMTNQSGASQYYSPMNPKAGYGLNQFIPDAQDYPFTETGYTPDNTGRISRQGGVGPTFQLGTGHETKYYYGTPDQSELDALFGTEVGNHSHYFKNMVRDANGQYSVTYVDMHGRTIATALAGNAPPGMAALPSNTGGAMITENLADSNSVFLQNLSMVSKKSLLVPLAGYYTFHYSLTPADLSQANCSAGNICYTCAYDLRITLTDNCDNQLLGGTPYQSTVTDFTLGSFTSNCSPSAMIDTFTLYLPEGSYEVTKTLSVDPGQYAYYRDSVYVKNNTCSSLQQYVTTQDSLNNATFNTSCFPNCVVCRDSLGTFAQYWARFVAQTGLSPADTAAYYQQALTAYQNALDACSALCQDSVSDDVDIENAMLADMTPPYGQYADSNYKTTYTDKYSIFYMNPADTLNGDSWIPVFKYPGITYTDENGNPDSVFDPASGLMVPPTQLSMTEFIQNFRPSWAGALLPYHPEYCKLLACQAQQPSNLYDRRMEAIGDFRDAYNLGYLDPTGESTSPYSRFSPTGTGIDVDPFATESGTLGATLRTKLEALMLNYKTVGGVNVSMWAMACVMTKCTSADQPCLDFYAQTLSNQFDTTAMCEGDLDMSWRNFRELYTVTRQDLMDQYVIKGTVPCPAQPTDSAFGSGRRPVPTMAQLYTAGHAPEFTDQALSSGEGPVSKNGLAYINQVTGSASVTAAVTQARDTLNGYYATNAASYVSLWIEQLAPCGYDPVSLNDTIIPRLTALCRMACDSAHPFGASSLPPGETYTPTGTAYHFTSFGDILTAFNQLHGTGTLACNAELINAPAPYSTTSVYAVQTIYTPPSGCECGQINSLYNAYLAAGVDTSFAAYLQRTEGVTMSPSDLTTLLTLCNSPDTGSANCDNPPHPIALPVSMQCNSGEVCVACVEVDSLYARFLRAYPGDTPAIPTTVDTIQAEKNLLFQNYMNNRLGFTQEAWEYLTFLDSCASFQADNGNPTSNYYGTGGYGPGTHWGTGLSADTLVQLRQAFLNRFPTTLGAMLTTNWPVAVRQVTHLNKTLVGSTESGEGLVTDTSYTSDTSLASIVACTWTAGDWFQTRDNVIFNFPALPLSARINSAALNLYHKDTSYEYFTGEGAHYRLTGDSIYGIFTRALTQIIPGDTGWNIHLATTETNMVTIPPFTEPDAYQIAHPDSTQLFSDQDYTQIPFTGLARDMYTGYKSGENYGMVFSLGNDTIFIRGEYTFWANTQLTAPQNLPILELNISAIRGDVFTYFIDSALGYPYTPHQVDSLFFHWCGFYSGQFLSVNPPGPTLCGKTQPVFQPQPIDSTGTCTDSTFFSVTKGTVLYQHYTDSLTGTFEQRYDSTCMNAFKTESFTVTHQENEYHYTLYYYDQAGNLEKTVPPAGVHPVTRTSWIDSVEAAKAAGTTLTPNDSLQTNYRYNTLNQVVAQQSPDAGMSDFWYDRLGRLAISQNARQQSNNQYSYTVFDSIGRITEVGQITNGTAMTAATSRNASSLASWLGVDSSTREQITQTNYDYAYTPLGPELTQQNLRNRVSWAALYNTANDYYGTQPGQATATYYSYDILGNVDTLVQDYRLGDMGISNRFKKIVYDYDLQSGKIDQLSYQHGAPDAFYQAFQYDAENRLTNVLTSQDSVNWDNDAYYAYYLHGPLERTVLGDEQVQGLNYAYTLQGWIKEINPPIYSAAGYTLAQDGASGSPVATNAYNLMLDYFQGDYSAISGETPEDNGVNTTLGTSYRPLYNGNISGMGVDIKALGHPLLYNYQYDQLNRLVAMDAWNGTEGSAWSTAGLIADYGERVSYDPNGNILGYHRNGDHTFNSGDPVVMDSLHYLYTAGTNRLDHITDSVPSGAYPNDLDNQSSGNYAYDGVGELTQDNESGISNVTWTVYGKIASIAESGQTILFTYDAAGDRITKAVVTGGDTTTTYYVRDAQGNILSIYTKGNTNINSGDLSQTELDLYGSERLGTWNAKTDVQNITGPTTSLLPLLGSGEGLIFTRGNKLFELSNHLDNVLATITDRKIGVSLDGSTVDHFTPQVVNINDYYPGGMLEPGRTYTNGSHYRYGFNGKEKSDEIEGTGVEYDYGARIYDTRISRWLSVDPLKAKLSGWSPYSALGDNPILMFDLDGQFPFPITVRSFAPTNAFKGLTGLGFNDDKRGYSPTLGVTSRITQTYTVDPTKHTITGGTPTSSNTYWQGHYAGNATNTTDEGQVDKTSFSKNSFGSDVAAVDAHFSGSNPAFKGAAPNIAVTSSVILSENDKKGYIIASVDLSSKQFPATEALITDTKGQTVWLTGAAAYGNPTDLTGGDVKPIASVDIQININTKGEFQSVMYNGKSYSLDEWNKAQTAKPAGPLPRSDKDKQAPVKPAAGT